MAVTATNVLQGAGTLLISPFGSPEPANATTAPTGVWVDAGATSGGATLTLGQTYTNKVVDQIPMPVGADVTDQMVTIATSMAEATLANYRAALNMAAATATTLEFGGTAPAVSTYSAVMLKGVSPAGTPRLVIIRRALSTESIESAYTKDGIRLIPVTFTGYYVSDSIKAVKIDDTAGV